MCVCVSAYVCPAVVITAGPPGYHQYTHWQSRTQRLGQVVQRAHSYPAAPDRCGDSRAEGEPGRRAAGWSPHLGLVRKDQVSRPPSTGAVEHMLEGPLRPSEPEVQESGALSTRMGKIRCLYLYFICINVRVKSGISSKYECGQQTTPVFAVPF